MNSDTFAFESTSIAEGTSLPDVHELHRSPSNPFLLYSQEVADNQPLPLWLSNSSFGTQSTDLGMV
jgi:hypothetical protein